jgi:hypothetical protein
MTMRWPKQLTDYTRPRLSGIAALGAISTMWSLRPWNGWIGLTIAGYWSRSEIFRRQNLKWHIIAN